MAEKTKAPSKNHKWDAKNKRWVLKTFEERQKGRNILLQGKNNPIRIVHDTIRNANAAKEVRKKDSLKTNNKSNNTSKSKLTETDKADIKKEKGLAKTMAALKKGGGTLKDPGPGKQGSFVPSKKKKPKSTTSSGSTVHTRHYKTGERLGVMTRSQRRAYDKEAAGRSFESEVAKHEKSSGHGKSHLRETLYKRSLRKGKTNKSSSNKGSTNKTKLKTKSAYDTKLDLTLTDSKVYGNKNKKKKKKNLSKNETKYPTRGTFRGI